MLLSHSSGEAVWQFKHPTIGDAYAAILIKSPEHLGIFVQGSAPDRLVEQVTCGDVGIEKAVVVPRSLFPQMLTKLSEISRNKSYKSAWLSTFGADRELQGFLARRCSKEFLSLYLQHNPGLLDQVSEPGLFLDAVPEVRLAKRLHEFGLLPEGNRRKFIDAVSNYAIEGEDADALDDEGIRSLFTDDEFEEFVRRVRAELLPRLGDVRRTWEWNRSPGQSPEEHMQPLLEVFDSLKKRLSGDESAITLIDREIRCTNEWIGENTPEEPERSPRKLGKVEAPDMLHSTRSMFDDIDADEGVDSA